MGKDRQVLSDTHARALIKQAIGLIFGDTEVEADATAEIAAIEAQKHPTAQIKSTKARRSSKTVGTTTLLT